MTREEQMLANVTAKALWCEHSNIEEKLRENASFLNDYLDLCEVERTRDDSVAICRCLVQMQNQITYCKNIEDIITEKLYALYECDAMWTVFILDSYRMKNVYLTPLKKRLTKEELERCESMSLVNDWSKVEISHEPSREPFFKDDDLKDLEEPTKEEYEEMDRELKIVKTSDLKGGN